MNCCFGHKSDLSQNLTNDYENKKHFRFEAKEVYCSILNIPAKTGSNGLNVQSFIKQVCIGLMKSNTRFFLHFHMFVL